MSLVDIDATAQRHKHIIPNILEMHVITGCDTVSYMYVIGKATAMNTITKSYDWGNIGESDVNAEFDEIMVGDAAFTGACIDYKDQGNMHARLSIPSIVDQNW